MMTAHRDSGACALVRSGGEPGALRLEHDASVVLRKSAAALVACPTQYISRGVELDEMYRAAAVPGTDRRDVVAESRQHTYREFPSLLNPYRGLAVDLGEIGPGSPCQRGASAASCNDMPWSPILLNSITQFSRNSPHWHRIRGPVPPGGPLR